MERSRWLQAATGLAVIALVSGGCEGGHGAGQGSGGAAGTSTASGGVTEAGGAGGRGGAQGQVTASGGAAGSIVADRWSTELYARGPVMAVIGAEAAVAYSGWSNDANILPELLIHRIDAQGVRKGTVARKTVGGNPSVPSIASDDQRYVICLGSAGQIECSSLTPEQGDLVPVYAGAGFTPAVIHGSTGWLLAWRASEQAMTTIMLQSLTTRFEAVGPPVSFPSTAASSTPNGGTFAIAATPSGYVLVTGDPPRVQRLDSGLQAVGAPIELATPLYWSFSALAATDSAIAIGLRFAYSAKVSFVDASNHVTTVELRGGLKEGMPIGLVADQGTLAGVWAASFATDPSGWHFQRPLDQAPPPTPTNDPGAAGDWPWDTYLALGRVGDGFVAAFARTHGEIQVLRLGR